jgi:large subunit ribosomal protein L24
MTISIPPLPAANDNRFTFEAPIHVSNVMVVSGKGTTRLGFKRVEATKRRPDGSTYAGTRSVRISRRTGKEI